MLEAPSAGAWGNRLSAAVDYDTDRALPRASPPAIDRHRFNLAVRYQPRPGREEFIVETFGSVSTDRGDPRFLPLVLERESAYVRRPGHDAGRAAAVQRHADRLARTVTWVDADADSGKDGAALDRRRHHRRARPEDGHLRARTGVDLFNLLCIPPLTRDTTAAVDLTRHLGRPGARHYCATRRAVLIVDPPRPGSRSIAAAENGDRRPQRATYRPGDAQRGALLPPPCAWPTRCATTASTTFVPCGAVAGVIARTDAARGVWKAPAGLDAALAGVQDLHVQPDRRRERPAQPARHQLPAHASRSPARVVWGARTLRGADQLADEWKYLPVRRTGAVHRGEPVPRHAVGGVRAQRRAAVGADPPQRRRLHAEPVPPGRVPGHDARARPTSSSATARPPRRTTSTSASSTSSSASRR